MYFYGYYWAMIPNHARAVPLFRFLARRSVTLSKAAKKVYRWRIGFASIATALLRIIKVWRSRRSRFSFGGVRP